MSLYSAVISFPDTDILTVEIPSEYLIQRILDAILIALIATPPTSELNKRDTFVT